MTLDVNFNDPKNYQNVPEFHDTEWCWLEIYPKEGGYIIYPQFYSINGDKKYRSTSLIEKEKLQGLSFAHSSGKIVHFYVKDGEYEEFNLVFLYRNIQSFNSFSGKAKGSSRYPVQAILKMENGKEVCKKQVKLMNDGNEVFTDNYL